MILNMCRILRLVCWLKRNAKKHKTCVKILHDSISGAAQGVAGVQARRVNFWSAFLERASNIEYYYY